MYSLTTTIKKPYTSLVNNYIYQPHTTTKSPYNFANFGINEHKRTTKTVHESYNKQFYSTTNPYSDKPRKSGTKNPYNKKTSHDERNRLYTSPLQNSKYSETTPQLYTTAKTYTTIKNGKFLDLYKLQHISAQKSLRTRCELVCIFENYLDVSDMHFLT